jgi:integrase
VKSRAGRRTVGLPDQLVTLLREHREAQKRERVTAADLWQDDEWVFAMPDGSPLNPNTDCRAWKLLLPDAGIRDGWLYDARHAAATVVLILGVPERAVMELMGWPNTAMARRYQHLVKRVRDDTRSVLADCCGTTRTPPKDDEDGGVAVDHAHYPRYRTVLG